LVGSFLLWRIKVNEVLIENQELTEKAHPIVGFFEIIMQPYELGRKIIPRWFQIVAIAVLLETFCMTTGMYLVSKSDGVKSEMAAMNSNIIKRLEKNPQITDEQLEEMKEQFDSNFEFKPLSTVGVSLIYSLFGIFVVGAFFFFAARLFVEQPSPYPNIMGLTAFGAAISGLGVLVSTMIQFLTDTTVFGLTLSFVVDPAEHPAWFSFLSRISIFYPLYYIAIGSAVAGASRMHKQWGYILAIIVCTVTIILWGGISAVGGLFM
jgi:hypothetical protein